MTEYTLPVYRHALNAASRVVTSTFLAVFLHAVDVDEEGGQFRAQLHSAAIKSLLVKYVHPICGASGIFTRGLG